jgi:hypothetical protein
MKYRIITGTIAATSLVFVYASALASEGLDAKASAHFIGLVVLWQVLDVIKALGDSA